MPFWKFTGIKPVNVGSQKVSNGQVVQFSGSPGGNFEEVADMTGNPIPQEPPKATSSHSSSSGSSTTSRKKE